MRRIPSSVAIAVALVAGTTVGALGWHGPAAAATFGTTTAIAIADASCGGAPGTGSPYPSPVAVTGTTGSITDVDVTLSGVTHPFQGDLELLLVSPSGRAIELLSDAGTGSLSAATIQFDDAAASAPPQNSAWAGGTYRPADYAELSDDVYPAPAPTPSGGSALSSLNGSTANGTWKLYTVDDACPDGGSIGGWSLSITTMDLAPTTTSLLSSSNPAATGEPVTFTAAVGSGGSPVTTGTVTFSTASTVLAANVPLNEAGRARLVTSDLPEGDTVVRATFDGTAALATSTKTVSQRIDTTTSRSGNTFCNRGGITLPSSGPAAPYGSKIVVAGVGNRLDDVDVILKNVFHPFAGDIDAMLVAPDGTSFLKVVSDVGTAAVSNVTVRLDDAAAAPLPASGGWSAPRSAITRKPTNLTEQVADSFPAPAPRGPNGFKLGMFDNSDPNGTWQLFVVDDGAPDGGSISGGWCLDLETRNVPTLSTIASDGVALGSGGTLSDTAKVTGLVDPQPGATIDFRLFGPDDATCSRVPVFKSLDVAYPPEAGAVTSGSFTPAQAGVYRWRATYSGDANNLGAVGPCGEPSETRTVTRNTPDLDAVASTPGRLGSTTLTDRATVSSRVSPTGAATFDFRLYRPGDATCSGPAVFEALGVVGNPTIGTTTAYTPSEAGVHRWRVTYLGDANNLPVTTACGATKQTRTVLKAKPSMKTTASGPTTVGGPLSATAEVLGRVAPLPGATVDFRLYRPGDTGCTSAPVYERLGVSYPPGSGPVASGSHTATTAGTYRWVVRYSGDTNNATAANACNATGTSTRVT